MAVGISFITATPGYHEDLMSYLFGNILMVGKGDIIHMAVLDIIIIGVVYIYFEKFLIISFQPELARLRGLNVAVYQILLLILISLTIVLLTRIVGLVMVIALLTLPAATASLITGRLWTMMVLAASFCLIFTVGGIAISYGPELPAGATVIEITGAGYLFVFGIERFFSYRKRKNINANSCIEDNSNIQM
jgi:zinc transport system permease protein